MNESGEIGWQTGPIPREDGTKVLFVWHDTVLMGNTDIAGQVWSQFGGGWHALTESSITFWMRVPKPPSRKETEQ